MQLYSSILQSLLLYINVILQLYKNDNQSRGNDKSSSNSYYDNEYIQELWYNNYSNTAIEHTLNILLGGTIYTPKRHSSSVSLTSLATNFHHSLSPVLNAKKILSTAATLYIIILIVKCELKPPYFPSAETLHCSST